MPLVESESVIRKFKRVLRNYAKRNFRSLFQKQMNHDNIIPHAMKTPSVYFFRKETFETFLGVT